MRILARDQAGPRLPKKDQYALPIRTLLCPTPAYRPAPTNANQPAVRTKQWCPAESVHAGRDRCLRPATGQRLRPHRRKKRSLGKPVPPPWPWIEAAPSASLVWTDGKSVVSGKGVSVSEVH